MGMEWTILSRSGGICIEYGLSPHTSAIELATKNRPTRTANARTTIKKTLTARSAV